jgi:cell division protein FtsL
MDVMDKSLEIVTKKIDKTTNMAKWFIIGIIAIALTFGATISIVVCKYFDKAYDYTQMEQQIDHQDQTMKQFIK